VVSNPTKCAELYKVYDAAVHRCLTNMATGDHSETGAVLCAVPNMVEILNSNSLPGSVGRDSVEFQEHICWALGNIAGDSDEHRSVLIGNGALLAVLSFLEARMSALVAASGTVHAVEAMPHSFVSSTQTAAWTLSNLARGKVPANLFVSTGTRCACIWYGATTGL
jgi:hypothetical protein